MAAPLWLPRPRAAVADAEVVLHSRAYKHSTSVSRYTIDARFLRDPGASGTIRAAHQNGLAPEVIRYMTEDDAFPGILFFARMAAFSHLRGEKLSWFGITITDHHGQWGAPALAEALGNALTDDGWKVYIAHPHLHLNALEQSLDKKEVRANACT